MITDLKNIIKLLKELRTQEELDISDEVLFQGSVKIFNTKFITNHRQENLSKSVSFSKPPLSPATQKDSKRENESKSGEEIKKEKIK